MIRQIFWVGILISVGFIGSFGQSDAFACNKTSGCVLDVSREDYSMRRDGRAEEAIRAGRANVEAFRSLQEAEKAYASKKR